MVILGLIFMLAFSGHMTAAWWVFGIWAAWKILNVIAEANS